MNKKVLVLGAGITGLSTAWKLAEQGIDVEVIESNNMEIGGLAATVRKEQYLLDYGPHFFLSQKPEFIEMINSLISDNMICFKRDAKLYFHGRFYAYPLTARNVLFQMPIFDSASIVFSYFGTKLLNWKKQKKDSITFEDWAKNNFGNYLYKMFFKPYTEQFWKIPAHKLSPDSMPTNTKISFFKILRLLFVKDVTRSSLSTIERETTLPLYYPRKGIAQISEAIARKINSLNGDIRLGWTIIEVNKQGTGEFIVKADNGKEKRIFRGDFLVSTIPLTDFIKNIKPDPPMIVLNSADNLNFLSLIVMYLVVDEQNILPSSYMYYVGRPYNRIAEINKFCSELSPPNENMLAIEISCHREDPVWRSSDEEIFNQCIEYLEKDNIIQRKKVKKMFILKTPNAYPIYRHNYKGYLDRVLDYVGGIENLEIVGRSGRYMYMDMDLCMEKAFDLAEKISEKIEKERMSQYASTKIRG